MDSWRSKMITSIIAKYAIYLRHQRFYSVLWNTNHHRMSTFWAHIPMTLGPMTFRIPSTQWRTLADRKVVVVWTLPEDSTWKVLKTNVECCKSALSCFQDSRQTEFRSRKLAQITVFLVLLSFTFCPPSLFCLARPLSKVWPWDKGGNS